MKTFFARPNWVELIVSMWSVLQEEDCANLIRKPGSTTKYLLVRKLKTLYALSDSEVLLI